MKYCPKCFQIKEECDFYKSKIHVDHNHGTNTVRELLCHKCNIGLSYIEDKKFLKSALRYLEKHYA